MSKRLYSLNPSFYLQLWGLFRPQKKSPFDFKRSLQKALSGGYEGILFDESFLEGESLTGFIDESLKTRLRPALSIIGSNFKSQAERILRLHQKYKESLLFNIIFEDASSLPLKGIERLFPLDRPQKMDSSPQIFFTYVVTKNNKRISLKRVLPQRLLAKTEYLFPYKESFFDPFLTPGEVYKFIKKQGPCLPPQSDIYDSRIAPDMDLEPLVRPFAENKLPPGKKKIYFSIIIPSYNSEKRLIRSLKRLALQNYPRDEYEIIAVDDGSSDNTRRALRRFMESRPSLNFKAVYFPRVIERKAGDGRFRAGLARNLGVRQSSGAALVFLDADILLPPDALQKLKEDRKRADVILIKRHHLKAKAPLKDLFYDHSKLKGWHYIEEKSYWGDFYQKGFSQVKPLWKYVASYGLSVSRESFQAVGGFGKSFIFYGFEDTDLGYKLFKQNKKFLLSDILAYHQPPDGEERGHTPWRRHIQLSKTAKIFFYRHLDPEIYEEMRVYMTQKRGFYYFLPFLRRLFFKNGLKQRAGH